MPQALVGVLVKIGLSKLVATIVAATVIGGAAFLASKLLFGARSIKPDQSETTIKNPKPPRVWIKGRRRSYGAQMGFGNYGQANTWDVWAYCEGPANAVIKSYINDDPFTVSAGYVNPLSDGAYGGQNVQAGWNLGLVPQPAHAAVVAAVPDWTASHRGDGIVSGYLLKTPVKSEDFLDVYPQGDQVTMSLVVEGSPCHDPRDPASDPYDPATWPYSDNSALVHLWFRMVIKGDDYNERILPVEDMWIAAANDCDVAMPLAAGGTENKYRAWVMFDSTSEPADIEDEIKATYDGWTAIDEAGAVRVYSGVHYVPTVTVGPDEIIDYTLIDGVQTEDWLNEIIVRTISADHDYLEVECQAWRDEADILARGEELSSGLDLQIPSYTQGRRLAKRRMAKTNAPNRGSVKIVHSARDALYERFINLRIEEEGYVFFEGVVEITGGERDYETSGATIEWIARDANEDSWNPAAEDGQGAPIAEKSYLSPAVMPTIADAVAELDSGGVSARIAITFDPIATSSATWFTRWRVTGDSSWLVEAQDLTAGSVLRTGQVPLDSNIDVQIAYTLAGGRFSDWSGTSVVSTDTSGLAPSPNTGFTASGGVGAVTGGWSNSVSTNFGHSELWHGTTSDFGTASQLGADYFGGTGEQESFDEPLAANTYYLWTVAVNAAGTAGAVTGPISVVVT